MYPESITDHPLVSQASRILDISVPVFPQMPVFPGDPGVQFESVLAMDRGDVANVACLHIGSQTGTHYDTPHHILNNGMTSEQIPMSACYGPAQVIEIPADIQSIDVPLLQQADLGACPRLLLKTRNSSFWQSHPNTFRQDYAALTPEAAAYVASFNLQLIGIDYLSIEPFGSKTLQVHQTLMAHNILILEGLNLAAIAPGFYTLVAFPVFYQGLDGAPTRAILLPLG